MKTDVSIPTPDGDARAFVFTPDASRGAWPAVILYMDGPAIRHALFDMADRLAQAGYYVLLPDGFWRAVVYPPVDASKLLSGDPEMVALFQRLRASSDPARAKSDTAVYMEWLNAQAHAKAERVGVVGYCMGGGLALRAAGTFPSRVVVAATFHGGHLATDEVDSPHRLAAHIRAKVLVVGADQDRSFDPNNASGWTGR